MAETVEIELAGSRTPAHASALQALPGFDRFIAFIDRSPKTAQTYLTNLRQFAAWLRHDGIVQPERADIIRFRDYLASEHTAIRIDDASPEGWSYRTDKSGNRIIIQCRPNTVAQYLRSVCQFFRWTSAENLYPNIADNIHAPKIRNEAHKKEALAAADVLAIEKSITAGAAEKERAAAASSKDAEGRTGRAEEQGRRLLAMYLLAVNAGLRTIELERANIKDLEVRNGSACLYVWGKGHADADSKKPLAPEVYAAIREYLKSRQDSPSGGSPLFVATGNRSGGKRLAARTIGRMLKKAMQQAGYDSDRITAHSLRHTAGTNVMELSGDLFTTQRYMRHSNPATTEIYLHNDTDRQEAQIARQLYDYYHGTGTAGCRGKLEAVLDRLTPDQLDKLAGIASALSR